MRTTIDKAGRLVIPKPLRDSLGLLPGEVEVSADGLALRVEPVPGGRVVSHDGRLVIEASEPEAAAAEPITDELIRALRLADQR